MSVPGAAGFFFFFLTALRFGFPGDKEFES